MILLKNKSSVVTTFIGLFFLFSLLLMTGCEKEEIEIKTVNQKDYIQDGNVSSDMTYLLAGPKEGEI